MTTPKANSIEQRLERMKPLIVGGLFLICAVILVVSSLRAHPDFDLWWHLRMGMDWMQNGLSPWQDHYSFTFAGESISNPPIVFQVVIWKFTEWFGERGGQVAFKIAIFISLLLLMIMWLRQIKAPAVVYLLVLPLLVGAIQIRVMVRPELISYGFTIVALMLYHRSQLSLDWRSMLPVVALLLIWSLYHTPIFGYVIFGGMFLDIGIRLLRERAPFNTWLHAFGWGALAFLVGFANQGLAHSVLGIFIFVVSEPWELYIAEYTSSIDAFANVALFGQIVPLILVASAVGAVALSITQRRVGYALVLVIFLYSGLSMNRMITPAAIVTLVIFGHVLTSAIMSGTGWLSGPNNHRALLALTALISTITLANDVRHATVLVKENDKSWSLVPSAMTEYMSQENIEGKIFNSYQLGGFLISRLYPEVTVYIDGRTGILYPFEHMVRQREALQSKEILKEEIERYDIDLIILDAHQAYVELALSTGFELDYSDAAYLLFRKKDAKFPVLGAVWSQPFCWPLNRINTLSAEIQQANSLFLSETAARPLISVISSYLQTTSPEVFFESYKTAELNDIPSTRFFAYRAIAEGNYTIAAEQLQRLTDPSPRDRLAIIFAQLRAQNLDAAERSLQIAVATVKQWRNVETLDLWLLKAIIDEVGNTSDLTFMPAGFYEELQTVVEGEEQPLNAQSFCGTS